MHCTQCIKLWSEELINNLMKNWIHYKVPFVSHHNCKLSPSYKLYFYKPVNAFPQFPTCTILSNKNPHLKDWTATPRSPLSFPFSLNVQCLENNVPYNIYWTLDYSLVWSKGLQFNTSWSLFSHAEHFTSKGALLLYFSFAFPRNHISVKKHVRATTPP